MSHYLSDDEVSGEESEVEETEINDLDEEPESTTKMNSLFQSIFKPSVEDVSSDDDDENHFIDDVYETLPSQEKTLKKHDTPLAEETLEFNEEFEDDEEEYSFQKFNKEVNRNYILENHPECVVHNNNEVSILACVTRDKNNSIIDDHHRTTPVLTKYERTRLLGQRAKQINAGAKPYVEVPSNILDGYVIAEMELKVKKIPMIIRRPLPSGGCEYWKVADLEQIDF
jgi:DNA-directed RNA polymerase I, II, and III subunit RPABC2